MSTILAIDPGEKKSGWVFYASENHAVVASGNSSNYEIVSDLRNYEYLPAHLCYVATGEKPVCRFGHGCHQLVIEFPQVRGQMMKQQTIETIFWIGRFVEAWGGEWEKMDRKDVKLYLTGRVTSKDPHVRAAIIAQFPGTGGGSTPQIGIKKAQGPLYGVKDHAWQALGVALTWAMKKEEERRCQTNVKEHVSEQSTGTKLSEADLR